MRLHIVGGFLGSGKTTAITNAAKMLAAGGVKVSVISNGRAAVTADPNLVYANYSPSEEVINSCFSSNLDSLGDKIERLNQETRSDYLFAESVGSCTDLVSTVLKPLRIFNQELFENHTISTLVDARQLLSYLRGDAFLFSDEVAYIFEKQIEEADLLVINKIDMLADADFPQLKRLADKMLRGKAIITQNSFNPQNIDNWLYTLDHLPKRNKAPLEIDYRLYGSGEAGLSWLDEEISFNSLNDAAGKVVIGFVENIMKEFRQRQIPVGHMKFCVMDGSGVQEISFTAVPDQEWKRNLLPVASNMIKLRVNARVEATRDHVYAILRNGVDAVSANGMNVSMINAGTALSRFSISPHHFQKPTHGCNECLCLQQLRLRNAARMKDGSAAALAELESEEFECCGMCNDVEGCCC